MAGVLTDCEWGSSLNLSCITKDPNPRGEGRGLVCLEANGFSSDHLAQVYAYVNLAGVDLFASSHRKVMGRTKHAQTNTDLPRSGS